MTTLAVPGRSLVLVAGVPGAGKSSLLGRMRLATGHAPTVLDSDPLRERLGARLPPGTPYRRYRPLVHVWHRLRIVLTLLGPVGCVVVHLPATGAVTRAALLVLAALAVRDRYLVWVDVDPKEALHGQRSRGRVLRRRCFRRHARRGAAFGARLRAGYRPRGWRRVLVLDRGQAREGVVLAGGS